MNKTLHIFIINLKKDIEKKEHMQNLCQKYGLDVEFIEAVDGKALNEEDITKVYSSKKAIDKIGRELSRGEIGCALSHKYIYEKMVDKEISEAIIMEDDIKFGSSLLQLLETIKDFPDEWECILLNYHRYFPFDKFYCLSFRGSKKLNKYFKLVRFIELMHSTTGYIVSWSGAVKLLAELNKGIYKPIDHYAGNDKYVNLYGISPKVISIDPILHKQSNIKCERDKIMGNKSSILEPKQNNSLLKFFLMKLGIFENIKIINKKRIDFINQSVYCFPRILLCFRKPKEYNK